MTLLHAIDPLYVMSGFGVGVLVGMTGVGGGSLMTPLLILLFGVHPATAVGTDLLYAAPTKSVGTMVHGALRSVDWRVVYRLAKGSVPASIATLLVLSLMSDGGGSSTVITTALGISLFLTAAALIFRTQLLNVYSERMAALSAGRTANLTTAFGALLGVLVSISSVGAGAIGVTVLLLLYPRLSVVRVIGSDIAHAVPLTLVAGLGHWMLGSVDGLMLASLLCGSLPGIVIGSYAANRLPEVVLRGTLAAVLLVVATRLVF
ncbi:MAG TPA: sulfite exporter TauE/SafE family protein [Candidatus Cybelea sp.]|nr:sulfite exporter TauE/SafE family protein [Candidatus Cybelea sp.]